MSAEDEWRRQGAELIGEFLVEFDRLKGQCERYRKALEAIANEDYRGPRPTSAQIASKALEHGR